MLTILEAIQLSTEYLAKKGIESARTNAELLLTDILNCNRLKLYLSFDKPLSDIEKDKYRELIQRRGKFEPLQYITGKVDFYGLEFNIIPNVLIPRPETEYLIESVISKFEKDVSLKILDIGCGSGIIPVTLAKNFTNAEITTVDISETALECGRGNAFKHEVERNISFELVDIMSEEAGNMMKTFDLIVSNPPYVSHEEFISLQKEIVEYEPKNAVTDFADGLTFYKRITSIARDKLNNGGWLLFEVGQGQSEDVKQIMENNCFNEVEILKDLQKIERIIAGKKQ